MIELKQITKIFNEGKSNEFTALKNIDLTLASEKLTVFKGPSGSGKTTLLSIIGCMSRPTSGRIRMNGRETTSLPERFTAEIRRHTFGFIFQNYNLIKGMTVLENTMIPAYPEGPNYQDLKKRAIDLLQRLGIDSKTHQKVEYLSGGEQQRTAIARALINNPTCIIADEPTAHLDTDLALAFVNIMADFRMEGKTVLIASHDPLVFGAPIVDRIISLRDGVVIQQENLA
jgi:putative ABC transport system ATP-binding protein